MLLYYGMLRKQNGNLLIIKFNPVCDFSAATNLALLYLIINASPIARNGGSTFQHVLIEHDPLTP